MAMSLSQMLRPYAFQPPAKNAAVYRRFYSLVCSSCPRQQESNARPQSGRCQGQAARPYSSQADQESREEWESQTAKARSHATSARIQKLRDAGVLSYPRIATPQGSKQLSVGEFRSSYASLELADDDPVLLQGRILRIRKMSSKLVFVDIVQNFSRVQVMFTVGDMPEVPLDQFKETFKTLLRGDCISVSGRAHVTTAGELTLRTDSLPQLLSPSLAPLPTRLVNEKTTALNRHLDLLVHAKSSNILRFRSQVLAWLRAFFLEHEFLEVQTPILAAYAGGATARPFLTAATEFHELPLAMRVAPELWLKRLVVGGFDKVYEIGPAFRNEGLDGTHNPEFTMCEFYAAYANLAKLMDLTTGFIRGLARDTHAVKEKYTLNPPDLEYFEKEFAVVDFIPSLEAALKFKLPDLSQPNALEELTSLLATHLDYSVSHEVTLPKLLDSLAGDFLEGKSTERPLYITHHPACMSPLAKSFQCPETGQLVSARAELFVQGRELANMYEEENDPFEQRRKFEVQVATNKNGSEAADGQAVVDDKYIEALEHGLPPTGGWGCGIERLIMLLSGADRIRDTLSFGNLRNVVSATETVPKSKGPAE